ncbi:hypothetical protein P7D22_10210 [Lichenihabitans sp. Uapishka_5]|uniref:hypothetical protein n=1 Tax=Lichenihabitans sp. Uapishka_5 TaxID=3037302 RepID=UPI0029E7D4FA|nr:hypothetical protein [Lichenihabitans sp. Uapishka_5]MDX7951540.1 hypothetical protein [Lichenihabitans sp. Uapishka_5]
MRAEAVSRRFRDVFQHAAQADRAPALDDDTMMPLAEAARLYQDTQRGSDLHRFSAGLAETDDVLLTFWACRLAEAGVAIHGTRVMAARSELVPLEAMRAGRLLHHAARLTRGHDQAFQDFCDLKVKRQDLADLGKAA